MTPEQWFKSIPPFTKYYMCSIVILSLLVTFGLVSPVSLYLDLNKIFGELQLWRILTSFIFVSSIDFNFFFWMYMFVSNLGSLEREYYNTPSLRTDLIYMFVFATFSFSLTSFFFLPIYFPTTVIHIFIVHIYARKMPDRLTSLYSFTIPMWIMPAILVAFSFLFGQSILPGIVAILIAHLYHFVKDIVPGRYGVDPLKTPLWFSSLVAFFTSLFLTPSAPVSTPPRFGVSQGHRLGGD